MYFWYSVTRKLVRVWFHLEWFLKLYNLRHSDSSFVRWVQKSLKSRNSNWSYDMTHIIWLQIDNGPYMRSGNPRPDTDSKHSRNDLLTKIIQHYCFNGVCIRNTPWCVWVHSLYECTFSSKYESLFQFNSSLMKYAWIAFTCSIQNMMIQISVRQSISAWLQFDEYLINKIHFIYKLF